MGILIAAGIILLWAAHLAWSLSTGQVAWDSPWMWVHILVQTYLYTGLFITGHDAMHGTVSVNRRLNKLTGMLAVFLFAGMSYRRLVKNHMDHHKYPATEKDPDFYNGSRNFWVWWFMFMVRYTTIWQILIMAVLFNLLKLIVPVPALLVFWIVPAFLSTFQLFFFGTWIPHRRPHTEEMGKHRARTLQRNHFLAMLSCYFFGYHREHHEAPWTPWWQLYRLKSGEATVNKN
ncbi:MAG: fatty acid desaturase [Bacteroidota bacterium]